MGVLVAISIPIFTSQLEKSREAVDLANIRAAYAEVMTAALTDDQSNTTAVNDKVVYSAADKKWSYTLSLKQQKNGWQTTMSGITIGGVSISGTPTGGTGTATITYTAGAATANDGTVEVEVK